MSHRMVRVGFAALLALTASACSALPGNARTGPVRLRCAEPPTAALPSTPTHLLTYDGFALRAWTGTVGNALVYDPVAGSYRELTHAGFIPAPTGRRAVVSDSDVVSVVDVHTDRDRAVRVGGLVVGAPQWSPDGSRLLVTLAAPHGPGFAVIDAADGTTFTQWPDTPLAAPTFSWYPDGTRVVATVRRHHELMLYDLDGTADHALPVHGAVSDATSWSPDRQYVVVGTAHGNRIYRTDTGALVATLPTGHIPGTAAWWHDRQHLLIRTSGEHGAIGLCLVSLSGKTARRWTVPMPARPSNGPDTIVLTPTH